MQMYILDQQELAANCSESVACPGSGVQLQSDPEFVLEV